MKLQIPKYLFLIIVFWLSDNVVAQNDDSTVAKATVSIGEIMPTSVSKSVQNVRIISAKTIERQGAINLKEVLSKELNVRIGNDNILGSSLSLQGISGQNVKILLDGVPLIGRENGNIDLNQINLNNIDRIEIIEGPLSVIYGTDALGGVINLVSKKATSNKAATAFANAYYETIGQYNFGGGGMVKMSDMDFTASINRNFFEGYNPSNIVRTMLWKPKQQVFGNFGILNEIGKLRIRFTTDIFNEKIENKGTPVINHLQGYAFDEYYYTNRVINSLNLDYKIDKKSYWNMLTSFSFYQRDKITFRKDLVSTELLPLDNKEAANGNSFLTFMTRSFYSKVINDKLSTQVGIDININRGFGTSIESDRGKIDDYALFACAEVKPHKSINIKPGFRATYNSKYPAPFIPSIQVQHSGIKNLILRYAYGKGYRAPGLKELYLNFVDYNHNIQGNPDLKSEMSHNHNFSAKYKINPNRKSPVYIEYNSFYNQIYNQIAIVAVNADSLKYTYRNIDNFKSIGNNINFSKQYKMWNFVLGVSYIGIYNNAFELINKQKYVYSPEYRFQISKGFKHKNGSKTVVSTFFKHNGKIVGYNLDYTRRVTPIFTQAFSIFDATLNHSFLQKKLNLTVGCKNILNVQSIRASGTSNSFHNGGSTSMPISIGRSLFIQLNVNI